LDCAYNPTVQEESENDDASEAVEDSGDEDMVVVTVNVAAAAAADGSVPISTKDAMKREDWDFWKAGLWNEFDNFMKRGAWEITKLPKGRKAIRQKMLYKLKRDQATQVDNAKARSVALGFMQKPGVDYTETYAATVMDQSLLTMLAVSLYEYERRRGTRADDKDPWVIAESCDVEAAFLNSELEEEIYLEMPDLFREYCKDRGIEIPPDADCIRAIKSQYGLVQAAHNWSKMLVRILTDPKGIAMIQLESDPCVFVKRAEDNSLLLILGGHIDDLAYGGVRSEVENLKAQLRKHVAIKDLGTLARHLGVDYRILNDDRGTYIECSMEEYLRETVEEHEKECGKVLKDFPTPGKPQCILEASDGDATCEELYRRYVGRLLYAARKVGPDFYNAVRDLTPHVSNPGDEQLKALERVLGYLKHHYKPMQLRTPMELRVVAYSDSDWATDKRDRKSVLCHLITIGGALVHWLTRKSTGIAGSSTDAETQAASEASKDIKYENMMLDEIYGVNPPPRAGTDDPEVVRPEGVGAVLPSILHCDNSGTVFIARNGSVGSRTKHIDIRERYVLELTRSGELRVDYINTEDNPADMGSKNCKESTHLKHARTVLEGRFDPPSREDVGRVEQGCSEGSVGARAGAAVSDRDWTTVTKTRRTPKKDIRDRPQDRKDGKARASK
jgi:Reverse transcriptase (RNA-dependent DNA polymerase)